MRSFECTNCELIFEDQGSKIEYMDPVYGACTKYTAICPSCNSEVKEYIAPKPGKQTHDAPPSSCGCNCGCGR